VIGRDGYEGVAEASRGGAVGSRMRRAAVFSRSGVAPAAVRRGRCVLVVVIILLPGLWRGARAAEVSAECVSKCILDNRSRDRALLDWAVTFGPDVVPQMRELVHVPKDHVQHNALYVLSRIPEVAVPELLRVMESDDSGPRLWAAFYSRDYLDQPEVMDACVEVLVTERSSSNSAMYVLGHLRTGDGPHGETLMKKFLPRVLDELEKPSPGWLGFRRDAPWAADMLKLVGRQGKVGDRALIERIGYLRDKLIERAMRSPAFPEGQEDVYEAALFALANLGDEAALQQYIRDVTTAPIGLRKRRLILLRRFHPEPTGLRIVQQLIGDTTPLYPAAEGSDYQHPETRVCDSALQAIVKWYWDDSPVPKSFARFRDVDRERARQFVDAKLAAWEASGAATTQPKERLFERPDIATQPTTRPTCVP
jgi:hypothetical protein